MDEMIILNGNELTIEDVIKVTRYKEKISLSEDSVNRINASRQIVDDIVSRHDIIYGITTGFGKLSQVVIKPEDTPTLQKNLIMSHATAVGNPLPVDIVRGIILLRINALANGFSGIRIETISKLIEFLNEDITPYIPEQGSLGASGDLAPLSHMVLPILGLGHVYVDGEKVESSVYLEEKGVTPLDNLYAKEGLALINGTQSMTSIGTHTVNDALELAVIANASAALTLEALDGVYSAFDERIHQVRPHLGQIKVAKDILEMTKGSKHLTAQGEKRIQDAYSLRCTPQVHGASFDCFNHVLSKCDIEMNSVTDNPIVFKDAVISAGNFHGQPMALAFDYLKVGISELANISERRLERLVNPQLNDDIPAFLSKESGLNSGFMIVQYSAASIVSENKVIAHPASVDSITSSANQEDHVSMGTTSARGANQILKNTQKVIAMELLCAAQAIDLLDKKDLGKTTMEVYKKIRDCAPFIEQDTIMYPHIDAVIELIESGELYQLLESEGITWK
jgi:histidine ammonia-lyase